MEESKPSAWVLVHRGVHGNEGANRFAKLEAREIHLSKKTWFGFISLWMPLYNYDIEDQIADTSLINIPSHEKIPQWAIPFRNSMGGMHTCLPGWINDVTRMKPNIRENYAMSTARWPLKISISSLYEIEIVQTAHLQRETNLGPRSFVADDTVDSCKQSDL